MKFNKILIFSILFIYACQKEITINLNEAHQSKLFIEGMLYVDQVPKIYISNSNPFFSKNVTPQQIFARGTKVSIVNAGLSETLVADSSFNKFRCRWEPFYRGNKKSEYGKTYTLNIEYEKDLFTATTTINQNKPVIQKVEYTAEFFDVYGGHDGVIIELIDPGGSKDYYRFQMNRIIDTGIHHAHVFDNFINTCTKRDEEFSITDIGRIVFTDENTDGQKMRMPIEVSFEYDKGDEGTIYMQSLDARSAAFYKDLDDQLQAIQNPFVEPVYIKTQIPGAVGFFGSAVLSDPIKFIFPRDNP